MTDLEILARTIRDQLDTHHGFDGLDPRMVQVLGVAEEAGEFVGAFRRWIGGARRLGSFEEVAEELADVVIVAHVAAQYLGINMTDQVERKANKIFNRGWRDTEETK